MGPVRGLYRPHYTPRQSTGCCVTGHQTTDNITKSRTLCGYPVCSSVLVTIILCCCCCWPASPQRLHLTVTSTSASAAIFDTTDLWPIFYLGQCRCTATGVAAAAACRTLLYPKFGKKLNESWEIMDECVLILEIIFALTYEYLLTSSAGNCSVYKKQHYCSVRCRESDYAYFLQLV